MYRCKLRDALRAQCQPGDRICPRFILISFSPFREMVSRDRVLGICRSGVRIPPAARDFSLLKNLPRPPSSIFNAYRGNLSGIKKPERGVNDSSPSSAQVKNDCCSSYMCCHGVERGIPFDSLRQMVSKDLKLCHACCLLHTYQFTHQVKVSIKKR